MAATSETAATPSRHSPMGKSTAASAARASTSPLAPLPPQDSNVQVAVRVRPLNEREKGTARTAIVQCKPNSSEVTVLKRKSYAFDKVYGQYSTQKDVFRATVKPAVDEALAGYNCTVFAYGQTGTGKTYTMQGELSPEHEMAGIIPRSVRYIFDSLQAMKGEYSVKVSFLQIYNEELKDLLEPTDQKKLRLMEDPKRGGIYCQNLLEVTTTTADHVFELLATGVKNRITSETLMNENSSRSHSIFTVRIHCKENSAATAGDDLLRIGQLNLVDLAGSECIGRSGARNARAREAGSINQSLLTLGRVITALVDNHPHIPYRDSKLTRLLQESLGGRAKTTIIATLAPCADSVDETMSTLEYAHRAKSIKNKPQVNQKMARSGLLREYGSEIESLRSALQAARQKDGIFLPPAQFAEMEERIAGQSAQILELEDELEARSKAGKELEETVETQREELLALNAAKREMEARLAQSQGELCATKDALSKTTAVLADTKHKLSAFKQNEKVLLANGAAATKLFQDSEERVNQLLAKIGRKQQVEDANMELTSVFTGDSSTQITQFQDRLATHQKLQEEMFGDLAKVVDHLETTHSRDLAKLDKTVSALVSLLDKWNAQSTEQDAASENSGEQHRQELSDFTGKRHEALQSQLASLVELSKGHADAAAREVASSKERRLAFLEQVQKLSEKSRDEMETFLSEQSDKLLELQASIEMSIDEQTKQLAENNALLAAALEDSHSEQQQRFVSLKSQLSQFVDTCAKAQTEKLQEQTALLEQNKLAQEKHLAQIQQVSESEIKSSVEAIGVFSGKHAGDLEQLEQRMKDMKSTEHDLSADHQSLIVNQKSALTEWKSVVNNAASSERLDFLELLKRQSDHNSQLRAKKHELMQKFVGEHSDLQRTMAGDCTSLGDGLQRNATSAKRRLGSVSEQSQKAISESVADSSKRLQELEVFLKKRKLDAPTGTTPTKQTHSFPAFEATKVASEKLQESGSPSAPVNAELTRTLSATSSASTSSTSSAGTASQEVVVKTEETMASGSAPTEPVKLSKRSTASSKAPSSSHSSSSSHKKTPDAPQSRIALAGARGAKTKSSTGPSAKVRSGTASSASRAASSSSGHGEKHSAIAVPKRYRAKSPLGEATNLRLSRKRNVE